MNIQEKDYPYESHRSLHRKIPGYRSFKHRDGFEIINENRTCVSVIIFVPRSSAIKHAATESVAILPGDVAEFSSGFAIKNTSERHPICLSVKAVK